MQIKRFEAENMTAALRLVKQEFGSEAVILSARSLEKKKGVFWPIKRPGVEVTAAKDISYPETEKTSSDKIRKFENLSNKKSLIRPLRGGIKVLRGKPDNIVQNHAKELADLNQQMLSQGVEENIAQKLTELGITTVLDGGSWKPGLSELLPYIDIAICSSDFHPPQIQSSYNLISDLLSRGVSKVAITRGEKSILFSEGEGRFEVAVSETNIVDSLGAGDFFHGAFCYYYANQANFEKALKEASIIASFSCNFHGTRSWLKNFKKGVNYKY